MKHTDEVEKDFVENIEPIMTNRFLMSIGNVPEFMVYSFSDLHCIVDGFGKKIWDNINIRFYDSIDPSTAVVLMNEAKNSTRDVKIRLLGPDGNIVTVYTLTNSMIVDINLGEFNWNIVKPHMVTITVDFDDLTVE